MTRCLLALGANLGERATTLRKAVDAIARLPRCWVLARSGWHETSPVGGPDGQGGFLNGALLLETSVSATELCEKLLKVEASLGRQRAVRWDARVIDIDLLIYGSQTIAEPNLIIPHPRMSFRRFVLEPAVEIAGEMCHPDSGWTLSGLLNHLDSAPRYVAVTAEDPSIADWLADQLANRLGCPRLEETYLGTDSQSAGSVPEAIECTAGATEILTQSYWQRVPELCRRISSEANQSVAELLPVVSGFWCQKPHGKIQADANSLDYQGEQIDIAPALVIAVEPKACEEFSKKILRKKTKKKLFGLSNSPANFCQSSTPSGVGPLARIQSDDPEVVIQEAVAALESAWP